MTFKFEVYADTLPELVEMSDLIFLNKKVVEETQVKEQVENKIDWVDLFHSGAFELNYSLIPSIEDLKEELRLMEEFNNRCFDV